MQYINNKRILEGMNTKLNACESFTDDVFVIWPCGERDLKDFISGINTCTKKTMIKLSAMRSYRLVTFLDVSVCNLQ